MLAYAGSLHLGILPVKRGLGSATDSSGADGGGEETHLCLRDTWARVYLARACAAVIQSAHIAGGPPFGRSVGTWLQGARGAFADGGLGMHARW